MGSIVSSLSTILWLPIVVYVPALAFNQTTGIDIHIITPIVCIVCIFYTCVVSKSLIKSKSKYYDDLLTFLGWT